MFKLGTVPKLTSASMAVMSMEAFEMPEFDSRVYAKLQEAEQEAEITSVRYSSIEVLASIQGMIAGVAEREP